MRLPDADKKDFTKITTELSKEFERGQLNREEALSILGSRVRAPDESPHTFAYKLSELVKLAYPSFEDTVRKAIAKDYFMKGVHPSMQVALKSRATFAEDDISTLASETVRLTLAGVKSYSKPATTPDVCGSVDVTQTDLVNSIADVVVAKLRETSLDATGGQGSSEESAGEPVLNVNNTGYRSRGRGSRRGRGQYSNRRGARGGGRGNQIKKCRSCQSTDHLINNCPTKFCQACGQRGHNQYEQSCPNYS